MENRGKKLETMLKQKLMMKLLFILFFNTSKVNRVKTCSIVQPLSKLNFRLFLPPLPPQKVIKNSNDNFFLICLYSYVLKGYSNSLCRNKTVFSRSKQEIQLEIPTTNFKFQ